VRAFKLLKEEGFEEVNPHQQVVLERRERKTTKTRKDSARFIFS